MDTTFGLGSTSSTVSLQKLHLESGAHRVEVRAAGYETLEFYVRISP